MAAVHVGVDADLLPEPDPVDAVADLVDDADQLVSRDEREDGVEVAIDPAYLDGRGTREALAEDEFYASWMACLLPVEAATSVYTLPLEVWRPIAQKALQHRGRLYYRLVTTSAPDDSWAGFESSLPDEDATRAPGIDVWQRTGVRVVDPKIRPEEAFWRTSGQ